MNPYPRLRKRIKWAATVVSALLLVAWIGSNWYMFMWSRLDGLQFYICGGCIQIIRSSDSSGFAEVIIDRYGAAFSWWFGSFDTRDSHWVLIPLWPFAAVTTVLAAIAWHHDYLATREARISNQAPLR